MSESEDERIGRADAITRFHEPSEQLIAKTIVTVVLKLESFDRFHYTPFCDLSGRGTFIRCINLPFNPLATKYAHQAAKASETDENTVEN